jgi:hypothetical protein
MLRDFLQARAGETLGKEERKRLQRASADCMQEAGNTEDAVSLYRESHDWTAMARVIETGAAAMLAQGRGETVARWVEELPAETQLAHPWTTYWSAASRAQIAPREARLLYEKAFELFRARGEHAGIVATASGAMDAILYELDDFSLLDRWIGVLDDNTAPLGPPEAETRIACSMFVSLTLRQPQRRDIGAWIDRALAATRYVADVNAAMSSGLLASLTLMWTGLFSRASELIEAMERLSRSPGVTTFSTLTLKTVRAMHGALTADRDAALKAMNEGLEIANATGVHTWTFQLLLYAYAGALGQSDMELADELEKELEPHVASGGRFNLCLYRHLRAWHAMLRKDLMAALQHEKAALRNAVEVGCPFFEVLCRLSLAEILAECGDERKCVAHLQTLRDIVRRIDNGHLEFGCLIGFAQIAMEHGRGRPGLNALRRGLELGRQYGYQHFLWWRPDAVARVLSHALEAGIEAEYARSLITRRGLMPDARAATVEAWPWTFRARTLGGFSLQVRGAPLPATGKAQRKPLDMLKVLIASGGQQVSESRIADALWPRVDGDSAHRSFTSALHRLRRLLGEERALVLHEGRLSLDRRYFWIDTWAFEQLTGELDAERDAARAEKLAERVVALYQGPFMADEEDAAWCLQPRERFRLRFRRAVDLLCKRWESRGEGERARALREKSFEIEPLAGSEAI